MGTIYEVTSNDVTIEFTPQQHIASEVFSKSSGAEVKMYRIIDGIKECIGHRLNNRAIKETEDGKPTQLHN
jgi:hypothetical protein